MNSTCRRFIALPYCFALDRIGLQYKDLLIYVAIRSFNNSDTDDCFPAYETIAECAGVSRKFVQQSLRRLSKAELLTIQKATKKHVVNRYYFPKLIAFNMVPYEVFEADLSASEKGMLLCLRQFFVSGDHSLTVRGVKEVALGLGLTYKTVYTQYKSLLSKGYLVETVKSYRNGAERKKVILSKKLHWYQSEAYIRPQSAPIVLIPTDDGMGWQLPIPTNDTLKTLLSPELFWA